MRSELPEGVPGFDPQDYYESKDTEWPKVLTILKHLADKVSGSMKMITRARLPNSISRCLNNMATRWPCIQTYHKNLTLNVSCLSLLCKAPF